MESTGWNSNWTASVHGKKNPWSRSSKDTNDKNAKWKKHEGNYKNKNRYNKSRHNNRDKNNQDKNKNDKNKKKREKLKISDKGWKPSSIRNSDDNEYGGNVKTAQGYLNKITETKFDDLSEKFVNIAMKDSEHPGLSKILTDRIFEQALRQPTFCPLYANLCIKVHDKMNNFREILLSKCQEEFEKGSAEPPDSLKKDERDIFTYKARKRMLGNIKFIGELYKTKLLIEPIMFGCFQYLLQENTPDSPDEENIEALCKLLINTGKELNGTKYSKILCGYFGKVVDVKNGGKLTSRIRFMVEDVIDLKNNNWNPIK